MAIPVATTTIAVLRAPADPNRDPYDPQPNPTAVATGVRAHISSPSGAEDVQGGSQETVRFMMNADPVDLHHLDWVKDETSGQVYEVVWVMQREGFDLDHTKAGLKTVAGVT